MQLSELTPSPSEPISLVTLKLALKTDNPDDDTHIENCLKAARHTLEKRLDMAFVTRSFRMTLDKWPVKLKIPVTPALNILAVNVTNIDGSQTTIPPALYQLVNDRLLFYAYPIDPGIQFAGISIDFTAGFLEVPPDIQQAVQKLAIHYYENRGVIGNASNLPENIENLLAGYRKVRII
jgi:uncharacterized phiE125 gp8 family phage protein